MHISFIIMTAAAANGAPNVPAPATGPEISEDKRIIMKAATASCGNSYSSV